MKTLVSVVVPYYHGSRYLSGLLQTLSRNADTLREEYDAEMEVILVNDSPEESLFIARELPFSLNILVNPENSGIHRSRINGLKGANGEYILFLDQDDRIIDDCLVSQIGHIGKADFVIGNGYDEEADGGRHLIFTDQKQQICAADIRCHYYYNNLIRSPGQVLIRRRSIPDYWMEQKLRNNGSDDAFLWILMLCQGRKAAINENVVYEHVYTGENSSGDDSAMLRSQLEVAEYLRGIASPAGMKAFSRRAKYYCTSGRLQKLKYFDVGIARFLYSRRYMR